MIKSLLLAALLSGCSTPPAVEEAEPSTADAWLERIEAAARDTKTLHARVRWDRVQGLVGDEQRRFGRIVYLAGPPAKFAVHFDQLLLDNGRSETQDRWWIYDGQWLVERNHDQKQFIKRRITEQQTDPLAEGAGPFPVPLRADKAELLRRFEVTLVPAADGDPDNSVHLKLAPRDPRQVEHSAIDLWYDRQTLLPVRARTIKDRSQDEQIFVLREIKLNEPVDESAIDTRAPSEKGERGWLEQIE